MNREKAIELARQAGIEKWWDTPNSTDEGYTLALVKLAKLVEAETIERCACKLDEFSMYDTADAIRAMK